MGNGGKTVMVYCIDYYGSGEILQQRAGTDLKQLDGLLIMQIDTPLLSIDSIYIENGAIVQMPPKPTPHHTFDYTTKQWIDPRTPETEWPLVRAKRDRLIAATDWTQLPDVPLATKEAWAAYRQALRDVTLQPDPFNIVWPVAP